MTYTLAIDYGTSFTAAAMLIPGHEPELLEIEDSPRFPSCVVLGPDGELVVGHRARAVKAEGTATVQGPSRDGRLDPASPSGST